MRDPDFGGNYDQPRSRTDDGRNSIAVPVLVGEEIVGCINLTWVAKVASVSAGNPGYVFQSRSCVHCRDSS